MMHVLFGHEYMCVGVGVCANVCVHECVLHPHPLPSTTQMSVRWSRVKSCLTPWWHSAVKDGAKGYDKDK